VVNSLQTRISAVPIKPRDASCLSLLASIVQNIKRNPLLLWAPAQRKRATMLYFANVFIYFLWPPYSPALVNGGSRKFYTWWTLSVIREVTTWIFPYTTGWAKK